ncbi:MAG: hypothetical protein QOJ57_1380 [Thermoleophilaceae bacterium]|jgi:hypothetical protein|nr:hypothetical protein [Thermoleophilaceae bacterium]
MCKIDLTDEDPTHNGEDGTEDGGGLSCCLMDPGRSAGPGRSNCRARIPFHVAALCCGWVLVAGCGSTGDQASGHRDTESATVIAPAYRGGQFCFPKRETQYRSHGFTCYRKHLRKRV